MSDVKENIPAFIFLNLAGEVPDKVKSLFLSENAQIIELDQFNEEIILQGILVRNVTDFNQINKKYNTVDKDIYLVSLDDVDNYVSFLQNNGKLILNSFLIENTFYKVSLHKLLNKVGSAHIDEKVHAGLQNVNTFKIINHLRLGYYEDILAIDAFEKNFNLISIRGFLYNIIYYLTYLKQANIAGVPFEVEYGTDGTHFVLNIHAQVKNFSNEYIIQGFGENSSKDSLKHLLKSGFLLTDFFEATYLRDVSKVTFTGLWLPSHHVSQKTRAGFLIHNIPFAKMAEIELLDELKSISKSKASETVVDYGRKQEELENKSLPGSGIIEYAPQDQESILYEDPNLSGELVNHIIEKLKDEDRIDSIENLKQEDVIELIKGHGLEEELVTRLSSDDKDFLLNKLTKFEINKANETQILAKREELNNDQYVEDQKKEIISEIKIRISQKEEIEVTSEFEEELPKAIDSIIDADLKLFKSNKSIARELAEKVFVYLKDKVTKGIDIFEEEVYKALSVVKRKERELIQSDFFAKKEMEVGGLSKREEVLLEKLKKQENETEELRKKLLAANVALGSIKSAEIEKKEVHKKLQAELQKIDEEFKEQQNAEISDSIIEEKAEENNAVLEAMRAGAINDAHLARIEALMQKDAENAEKIKQYELEIRKCNIESQQKDALFEQQLQGKERLLKAKDTAIEKAKENITMVMEKKEKEIKNMGARYNALVSEVNKLKASNSEGKIKLLEREKITSQKNIENLNKQIENFRNKVKYLEGQDKSNIIEDELKKAKRDQISAESKLKNIEKDFELITKKYKESDEKAKKLTEENNKLKLGQAQLIKADHEEKKEHENELLGKFKAEVSNLKTQVEEKEKILKAYELKISELEAQINNAPEESAGIEQQAQQATESAEMKRLKLQVDKLEKDRAKMQEDARKKLKEQTDAINNYKKALTDIKGFENRIKIMEKEAEKGKTKIAELTKKLQEANQAKKAA